MSMDAETGPAPPLRTKWARTSDLFRLTKPGLLSLVLFTTLAGFCTAARGPIPILLLLDTLVGTALIAGGATAMNMVREKRRDARMRRTARRPLAAGRLSSAQALAFSLVMSAAGLAFLLFRTNPLTAVLAALVFACYLFLYTPLKTRTWISTFVGAVSGALPVVMGWTAAAGSAPSGAWILFAVVFFWQLPHFFAIGWMHREDYANAGFRVLPVVDRNGRATGFLTVAGVLVLAGLTVLPFRMGYAGRAYLAGAVLLGLAFLGCAVHFARRRDGRAARRLFLASAFYLPVLLALLILDKTVSR